MEALIKLVFIIAGAVLLIVGGTHHNWGLVILGIILLAIGGVWVFFFSDSDGDWDFF